MPRSESRTRSVFCFIYFNEKAGNMERIHSLRGLTTSPSTAGLHAAISLISRGGARMDTSLSSQGLNLVGGYDSSDQLNILGLSIPPEGRAVLCMATAMAIHYLAYSFARPSTIALFTSKEVGFKNPAAFPLAMAFISPSSLCLLLLYGKFLDEFGPRIALQKTTLLCSSVLMASAAGIVALRDKMNGGPVLTIFGASIPLIRLLVGALFIFRESYVQLLTSQHWSFMASVLNPAQSATWFAPISGLTSILSAVAGLLTSKVIKTVGLPGVLVLAGVFLCISLIFSEKAYSIAGKYGFNPEEEHNRRKSPGKEKKKSKQGYAEDKEISMFKKATDLFARVPTLGRLFWEILSSQALSTLLNVCFVTKLSEAIPDDGQRAGWTGKFFASINLVSCFLQFGVLPKLMKVLEPAYVWRALPMIMTCLTIFQGLEKNPSLYLVSGSLATMKVLEFSARRMLDEMVYVPLDYESRYLGKEVIGVFGYRFGKSGVSLALSALTSFTGQLGLQALSQLTVVAALNWLTQSYRLSKCVPTKAEAEAAHRKLHSEAAK